MVAMPTCHAIPAIILPTPTTWPPVSLHIIAANFVTGWRRLSRRSVRTTAGLSWLSVFTLNKQSTVLDIFSYTVVNDYLNFQ